MSEMSNKARYWWAVLYPENMITDWHSKIDMLLQLPFAYTIHDKDVCSESESRKLHLHLIICWPGPTTYKSAFSVFNSLSAPGRSCLNKVERIHNIRLCYDYLIHDTEACKKSNKFLYDPSERIIGNNFDIGAFQQIGIEEKLKIRRELSDIVLKAHICNYSDLYAFVQNMEDVYEEILVNYSSHFERLTRGEFLSNRSAPKLDPPEC